METDFPKKRKSPTDKEVSAFIAGLRYPKLAAFVVNQADGEVRVHPRTGGSRMERTSMKDKQAALPDKNWWGKLRHPSEHEHDTWVRQWHCH
jgi:hypothetical protein